MSEEQIKKIARDTFNENIMNNLDSSIIFKYIQELEKENKILDEKLGKHIEQRQEWIELLYMFKNQQKEFIEYITSYIELLNNKPDLLELSQKDVLEEILVRFKEITGIK